MKCTAVILVASIFMGFGFAQDSAVKEDLDRLQGAWVLVDREIDGKKSAPEEVSGQVIRFTATGDTLQCSSLGEKELCEVTVKLNPTATPKALDLVHVKGPKSGKKLFAIYKLTTDEFIVCNSLTERPTQFSTAEGSGRVLLVFRREKK